MKIRESICGQVRVWADSTDMSGKTVITFSSGIRLVHRLLILKLDSYTFDLMYGLCSNSFWRIAVFNLKLEENLFWEIFSRFWVSLMVD